MHGILRSSDVCRGRINIYRRIWTSLRVFNSMCTIFLGIRLKSESAILCTSHQLSRDSIMRQVVDRTGDSCYYISPSLFTDPKTVSMAVVNGTISVSRVIPRISTVLKPDMILNIIYYILPGSPINIPTVSARPVYSWYLLESAPASSAYSRGITAEPAWGILCTYSCKKFVNSPSWSLSTFCRRNANTKFRTHDRNKIAIKLQWEYVSVLRNKMLK